MKIITVVKMREIKTKDITETVARLCQEANFYLGEDVLAALEEGARAGGVPGRTSDTGPDTGERPNRCQGADAPLPGLRPGRGLRGDRAGCSHQQAATWYQAINEGVRKGYAEGYLRKSAVKQPFSARVNTKDNTPAIIHTEIVPGDKLKITVAPKGGGSENMSRFTVLKPAQGRQGVVDFVVNTVDEAGSNPCPPTIVGVGIGGTAEKAMIHGQEERCCAK